MSDNIINSDNISRRVIQQYDDKTIKLINKKRKRFNLDLSIAADERPNDKLFKNQRETATLIVSDLEDGTLVFIGVVGETQSGKTGTMIATIKQYMKKNIIPIENIYIITGLSDIMWCKQTKERVPDSIMCRVFHRSDLLSDKFLNEIKNKKNVLILMDEVHLAAKEYQTIYKCFNAAGLLDKENLFKNDIKIIQFTATPDGIYGDLNNWNNGSKIIISKPSANYTSSKDLLEQKRVFQYKPLVTRYDYNTVIFEMLYYEEHTDNKKKKMLRRIKRITEFINKMTPHQRAETVEQQMKSILENNKIPERFIPLLIHIAKRQLNILKNINDIRVKIIRLNRHGKLYHIIRTPTGDTNIQDNFKNIFDENDYCFEHYDENNKIDLNVLLSKQPQKHTFIFIKEKLRCAKTLCKTYLGIFYERHTKLPNDSTIIQGGLGRLTGYDDNGFSLCYTNIESIHKYRRILDNEFTDLSGWNSATTNKKKAVKTFNNESYYESDCESSEPDTVSNEARFLEEEHALRWETDHSDNAPNSLFDGVNGRFRIIDGRWRHFDGKLRTLSQCPPLSGGGHATFHNVLVYKDEHSYEWTVRKMLYQ